MLRESLQELLEAETTEAVGAGPGERSRGRTGYRAGHCGRGLVTRICKPERRVLRDREGRFATELFERYQRSEKTLVSALQRFATRALEEPYPYRILDARQEPCASTG